MSPYLNSLMEKMNMTCDMAQKRPMLVTVAFAGRRKTFSYYSNDLTLCVGDLVFVDGMFSEETGIVKDIQLDYATPPYNMKWIRSVVQARVQGHFFEDGESMVSLNGTLSAEQYFAMALGIASHTRKANKIALGCGIDLGSFEYDSRCSVAEVFKGRMAYEDDCVTFLSVDDEGYGNACLRRNHFSDGTHDCIYLPFFVHNNMVYFETRDDTLDTLFKHEIAILFRLRSVLKKITCYKKTFVLCNKHHFARILDHATGHVDITYNYKD